MVHRQNLNNLLQYYKKVCHVCTKAFKFSPRINLNEVMLISIRYTLAKLYTVFLCSFFSFLLVLIYLTELLS